MKIGYARVSTKEQSLHLQEDALTKAGCTKIYGEKVGSAKTDRPQLNEMIGQLRAGDVIVVWKLDRLGRSLRDLVNLVSKFQQLGVGFQSLQDNIDTTTPTGKLTFHLFAALAEFERDIIATRTKA
jgi:DNA invertase Pin-like site-specific DNA recombinase